LAVVEDEEGVPVRCEGMPGAIPQRRGSWLLSFRQRLEASRLRRSARSIRIAGAQPIRLLKDVVIELRHFFLARSSIAPSQAFA
jgi:hypothetical protein